jgi:ornithine carbamoyltransferase
MSMLVTPAVMPDDLLEVASLTPDQLESLLDLAEEMRRHPNGFDGELRGETVACLFEKPSTRTRVSLQAAAHRLGLLPVMLRPDELQLDRGEPIGDTGRVLSSYTAGIVARVHSHRSLEELAAAATVPVVNALSDRSHPLQALADLLTLRDHFGELDGLRVAYVGDSNNVARSLVAAGALAGVDVTVASPPGYGGTVTDPLEAVAGADAVYTDVWVSMGEDDERDRRVCDLAPFQVTEELMGRAKPEAVFLHCLPAHRGEEVAAAVIDGPRSIVFEQAANRLCTTQAVLYAYLGRTA